MPDKSFANRQWWRGFWAGFLLVAIPQLAVFAYFWIRFQYFGG